MKTFVSDSLLQPNQFNLIKTSNNKNIIMILNIVTKIFTVNRP